MYFILISMFVNNHLGNKIKRVLCKRSYTLYTKNNKARTYQRVN